MTMPPSHSLLLTVGAVDSQLFEISDVFSPGDSAGQWPAQFPKQGGWKQLRERGWPTSSLKGPCSKPLLVEAQRESNPTSDTDGPQPAQIPVYGFFLRHDQRTDGMSPAWTMLFSRWGFPNSLYIADYGTAAFRNVVKAEREQAPRRGLRINIQSAKTLLKLCF